MQMLGIHACIDNAYLTGMQLAQLCLCNPCLHRLAAAASQFYSDDLQIAPLPELQPQV